jgi:LPS-assembly protein
MARTLRRFVLPGLALAAATLPQGAGAQVAPFAGHGKVAPLARNQPVTFEADNLQYDRNSGIVTATGHVEAFQNGHVLRADTVTYDRNTNVAAARGHVAIIEPDGQVLYSDYAELTGGMREGVLKGMRLKLASNGKLAANGARRTEGKVNELSHVVYSTCNLCKRDPSRPPLWEIRARSGVQDSEKKRIEYQDAVLDIYGYPVAYLPYFWHADPSVRRESGFLIPSVGSASHLGPFLSVPYYWVLDNQSDVTLTPLITTESGPNLDARYRRRFDDGNLRLDGDLGYYLGKPQGDIFAKGQFSYNDTWRYGFDIEQASSAAYLNDYRLSSLGDVLNTNIYAEGFGVGSYSRLDAIAFQGLTSSINQAQLPYVLPRYEYDFFGEPDALGGRFSLMSTNWNILRQQGTNDQRLGARLNWERPFTGVFGEVYDLVLRTDTAGYNAQHLNQDPNFSPLASAQSAFAQPQIALKVNWPFVRDAGTLGTQLIEPIAQVIAAPQVGGYRINNRPNEDSLDFQFTDENLFSLNRYPGLDRQEGGERLNAGLHANWTLPDNAYFDGLVGQSYRINRDSGYLPGTGLDNTLVSDIVARATVSPGPWLNLTARTRLDRRDLAIRYADVVGSTGTPLLNLSLGYLHDNTSPYTLSDFGPITAAYFVPRDEITLNASTHFLGHWTLAGFARRDLVNHTMVSAGFHGFYEDECFIFDANATRRYTSLDGDRGATIVLFTITLKTVGQFGFHAF